MLREYGTYLLLLIATALTVYGVSFFRPLTSPEPETQSGENAARFAQNFQQEFSYCQENAPGVDCECFAGVAGAILSEEKPRIPGAVYMDRQELARWQAESNC